MTKETITIKQINDLRKWLGFNLIEISAILNVGTLITYTMLEDNISLLDAKEQERLDIIHSFCKYWEDKKLEYMRSFGLHSTIRISLLKYLSEETFDHIAIETLLDEIATQQLARKLANTKERLKLKRAGFEDPVLTPAERREQLKKISRSIS